MEGEEPQHGGFLPPEPAGPEPELGAPPAPEPQPQQQWAPPAEAWQQAPAGYQQGWQPPPGQAPPGGQASAGYQQRPGSQPPTGQAPPPGQPPPGGQPPPPGYPPPPGQPLAPTQPPAYQQGWYQQPGAPQWAHPGAREPDNGPAVTGFVLSMVGAGLLLFLLAPVSLACSIFGIVYSRRGRKRVERGETRKNKGLAQAGFVTGIVVLVLSVLATLFIALFVIVYATDEEFRQDFNDDFENELDDSDSITAALKMTVAVVRAAASLLA